jgi:hypothetical protein
MASRVAPDFHAELSRLDRLLHREILRLRAAYQLSLDEFRGLYISDEQVDRLVAEVTPEPGDEAIERLTREAEGVRLACGDATPLGRAAGAFGLTPFERDVLLLALAPELDVKYETLYAYLNNDVTRKHPTADLALRLFARDGWAERALLHRGARLFTQALLEPASDDPARRSALGAAFVIAPALAAWIQGIAPFDPRLSAWVDVAEPEADLAGAARLGSSSEEKLDRIAGALRGGNEAPIVILVGEPEQCPDAAAVRLARALGRGLLRVDGARVPEGPPLALLALVARLRPAAVFLDAEQWSADLARRLLPTVVTHLYRAGIPVVLAVTPQAPWCQWVRALPSVCVALDEPQGPERQALWAQAVERAGVCVAEPLLAEVADRFRLGPAQIAGAARALAAAAPLGAPANEMRERLFQAVRDQSAGDLGQLATPVRHRHEWSDLVLPPVILARLKEVTGAIGSRATVFRDWGFGGRGGRGLMVLFAGASGTGKTMSASVIAREVGLDLYRIDLASVVSKYIGETEKNLQRVFEAARRANAVVFFDEADAMLGKRSEVKDARDRYANIEVAYLLQRMEDHDGVVILASNLSRNMDPAFSRRMHYTIEFPRPDAQLREQLWGRIFPPQAPLAGDVDFGFLARRFELTGGDIKTVALDAAFAAAAQGRAVAMADLLGAIARQMLKQGRPLAACDFQQYHGRIAGADDSRAAIHEPGAPASRGEA